jgi:hypothetical protein
MITKQLVLAACAAMCIGTAQAGPCDTRGKSANLRDAGSGPMVGSAGETTGNASSDANQHRPTSTMDRASGDAQKQQQGQPTGAQQASGVQPSAKTTGENLRSGDQGAEPSAKMTGQNQPPGDRAAQGAKPSAKMAGQGC